MTCCCLCEVTVFYTQKESQRSLQKDREDEKLQQAGHLTKLRLELFSKVS